MLQIVLSKLRSLLTHIPLSLVSSSLASSSLLNTGAWHITHLQLILLTMTLKKCVNLLYVCP